MTFSTPSDVVTAIFVGFTFSYFFLWLLGDFLPIFFGVDKSTKKLPQSSMQLSELRDSFKGTKLENEFNKYLKTIFQDQSSSFHTLSLASEYLNVNHLLGVENLKRWQTAANIMLGLGILGTFVGLTMGLWTFDMATHEQIMRSIQTLVPSMKTAFITSVAGMCASLLANAIQKHSIKDISRNLDSFCHKLDHKFFMGAEKELDLFYAFKNEQGQRVYPAQFMQNIMRDSSEQTHEIKKFAEEFSEGVIISPGTIDSISHKVAGALEQPITSFYSFENEQGQRVYPAQFMQNIMRDSSEQTRGIKRFTEDLAEGIILSSETMDLLADKIAGALERPMVQYMLPVMQDVQKAVDALRNEKQESIQEFIEGVSTKFTQSMESIAERLESSLTQSLHERLSGLAQAVADSGAAFEKLPQLMDVQIHNMTETMNGLSLQLRDDLLTQQQTIAENNEQMRLQLRDAFEEQTTHFQTVIRLLVAELSSAIEIQQRTVENLSHKLREELTSTITQQQNALTHQTGVLRVELSNAVGAQQRNVEELSYKLREELTSTITQQQEALTHQTGVLRAELSNAIEVQQRTVEDLSHKLRDELSSAITQQQEALADQTQAIHAAFSRLLQQEREQLESLMFKLKQQLTEDIDTQQTSLRYFTENIREQTQNASTILEDMLKQLQEQQAVGAQALQEVMGSTHQMLSSFQTSVQNITRAIGNMDDMFTNIQALSNHLNLASNAITQSSKVLSEVTQSFLTQSDQLSDKNQEILVKTIAAMQEATNMTQTYVEQFTTIKSGLVRIFADIDQGLKSYRDESRETLNRYLGDFSEHLSDAARTLATSVSGMKQVVEEIEAVHQQFPENVASVERLTQRLLQASSSVPATFQRFDEVRAGLERLLTQLPESPGVVHEKA